VLAMALAGPVGERHPRPSTIPARERRHWGGSLSISALYRETVDRGVRLGTPERAEGGKRGDVVDRERGADADPPQRLQPTDHLCHPGCRGPRAPEGPAAEPQGVGHIQWGGHS
jgi:hypothetical protein